MVAVNDDGKGNHYLRENGDVIAKFGKTEPVVFRPRLNQDKAENILPTIPDDSIKCVVTDPPYGIEFEQNRYIGAELGNVWNDTDLEFLVDVIEELERVLAPDGHLYMFTRWDAYSGMAAMLESVFGELDNVIVWDKDDGGHGMGDLTNWAPRHEWIMYVCGPQAELNHRYPNVIRQQDVRFTNEIKAHPTQKPRALIEKLIEPSTDVGDYVLDPFGGVYTTARAAMRMFRRSVSCELNPETHRNGVDMVQYDLRKDPEYGVDWREITGLEIVETELPSIG